MGKIMSILSTAKNVGMRLKGYRPVKLNDTKGIIPEGKKYKWEKYVSVNNFERGLFYKDLVESADKKFQIKQTVLPSGTIVEKYLNSADGYKRVSKKDGNEFSSFADGLVLKNGKFSTKSTNQIFAKKAKVVAKSLAKLFEAEETNIKG